MLELKRISQEDTCWIEKIQRLYEAAFPANERKSLSHLLVPDQDLGEILLCTEGGAFVGFVCLLNCMDISHIIYFAVDEDARDRGLGSEILRQVCRIKAGNRVIVDIERDSPQADNSAQRVMRKAFYLRNGFAETPVKYPWQGENYEILSHGGTITPPEFHRFWQRIDRTDKEMLY